MASKGFSVQSFLLRLIFALVLVYASYNPSGYSFFHWAKNALFEEALAISPPFAMSAVILLIGWTIYLRATLLALGGLGLSLAFAFFVIIVWWFIDLGLLSFDSISVMTYIALFILAAILATGMSWSHLRRRMSGQTDVDDVTD
ncbi:MAG: DUF6524 family protein [Pseudomonadota bacterium]|nr:DUF6524 family protein [Pseudomonadota bacterium]MDO7710850.1 DUF6524 family protein [Pseudomonadota bacterium]